MIKGPHPQIAPICCGNISGDQGENVAVMFDLCDQQELFGCRMVIAPRQISSLTFSIVIK